MRNHNSSREKLLVQKYFSDMVTIASPMPKIKALASYELETTLGVQYSLCAVLANDLKVTQIYTSKFERDMRLVVLRELHNEYKSNPLFL
jgi:hypothetical protein